MSIPPSWHPPSFLLLLLGAVAFSIYWLLARHRTP
jgi:hypothetical protein